MLAEIRYYWLMAFFRLREPFTDFRATAITYALYCFFIWLLALVWLRYHSAASSFRYEQVFFYIGVTEMFFMSFLSTRAIASSTEDFALFLARPRSWLGRELAANAGGALGKRALFCLSLVAFSLVLHVKIGGLAGFLGRITLLVLLLAPPQALIMTLFSSLRLSHPQTDYFILPFSKLFLALGGVFGPLSDYGEPWKSIFLKLPGSDLFFQPAYYAVHGALYELSWPVWLLRLAAIDIFLLVLVLYFYRRGRLVYQAWGG